MSSDDGNKTIHNKWWITSRSVSLSSFCPLSPEVMRRSWGSPCRSWLTSEQTRPPTPWSAWEVEGTHWWALPSRPMASSTRAASWSAKSTPTPTEREVRLSDSSSYSFFSVMVCFQSPKSFTSLFCFVDYLFIYRSYHSFVVLFSFYYYFIFSFCF